MPDVKVEYDQEIEAYHLNFINIGRSGWDSVNGIIQVIKATIPASNREYNTNTKTWTILKPNYEMLEPILKQAGFRVILTEKINTTPPKHEDFFYSYSEPTSSSRESKESLADKLIKLLECSPNDLADSIKLKRLYRAKALQYHPDRNNGDGSRMSELNSVWSAYNG